MYSFKSESALAVFQFIGSGKVWPYNRKEKGVKGSKYSLIWNWFLYSLFLKITFCICIISILHHNIIYCQLGLLCFYIALSKWNGNFKNLKI